MSFEDLLQKAERFVQNEEEESKKSAQEAFIANAKIKLEKLEKTKQEFNDLLEDLKNVEKGSIQEQIDQKLEHMRSVYEAQERVFNRLYNVTSFEEFLAHEEVASQGEVEEYNRLLDEEKTLSSNKVIIFEKLRNKYEYLESNEEDVAAAIRWLENQSNQLEKELFESRLLVPEEKEKLISEEANVLEKSLPDIKVRILDTLEFGPNTYSPSITQKVESVKFTRWWEAELVPKEFDALKATYGPEVAQEILTAAHKQKIHSAIEQYDSRNGNYVGFEKVLAENNSEALLNAKEAFRVFNDTVYEAQKVLKQKSEELLSKGISFDQRFIPLYGGTYEEVVFPLDGMSSYENIQSSLYDKNRDHPFPPKYPYKDIQKLIQGRTTDIRDFIEVVQSFESQEDIDNFGESIRNGASKEKTAEYFHKKQMSAKLDNKPPFQGFSSITEKVTSLYDAEQLVKNQKELYFKKEEVFVDAIENVIEAKSLLKELEREVSDLEINKDSKRGVQGIGEVTRILESFEREKKEAQEVLHEIRLLEMVRANDQTKKVSVQPGMWFIDQERKETYEALRDQLEKDIPADPSKGQEQVLSFNTKIQNEQNKLDNYDKEYKKIPFYKRFGIDKEKEKGEIRIAISKLDKERTDIRKKKEEAARYNIEVNSKITDFTRKHFSQTVEGVFSEVLEKIQTIAKAVTEKDLPSTIKEKYAKYKNLEQELE